MPSKRIPPTAKIDNEINKLKYNLGEEEKPKDVLGKLIDLGMRRIIQEILEKEVQEYIGQAYYKHGETRNGHRNGYENSDLKTAEGRLTIERPQVRGGESPFESNTWNNLKKKTEQLEKMAVEMYVRGCSTRDIEDLLRDEQGRILLSKSTVSELNEVLWKEYEEFCRRDLKELDVVYIFVDAVYEPMRLNKSRQEAILVICGILSTGDKVLLSIRHGHKESYENCLEIFRDLKKRNMCDPVLGVSDGAPGLIKAFEEVFYKTMRQRCLFHKKGNILSKAPLEIHSQMKIDLNAVYYASNLESAHRNAVIFRKTYAIDCPSAVKCFEDDLDACLQHLKCPPKHRKRITTTNSLERILGEENRRSKVIPRYFTEKSGLKLIYATLIRASQRWQRIIITFNEQAKIMELRDKLGHAAVKEQNVKSKLTRKTYALK
jgi:transposase-like protein